MAGYDQVMSLVSPVGTLKVRSDSEGDGHFLASRHDRQHMGLDLEAPAGTIVNSPANGIVNRWGHVYELDLSYRLVEIVAAPLRIRLFYVMPFTFLVPRPVLDFDPLGHVQDLRNLYGPKMTNHVHLALCVQAENDVPPGLRRVQHRGWWHFDPLPLLREAVVGITVSKEEDHGDGNHNSGALGEDPHSD